MRPAPVESIVGLQTLIATNTSISITQLAAVLDKAGPLHRHVKLLQPGARDGPVELIRGLQTTTMPRMPPRWSSRAWSGASPVTARNSPGFAVNRVLCPMINEAILIAGRDWPAPRTSTTGMRPG